MQRKKWKILKSLPFCLKHGKLLLFYFQKVRIFKKCQSILSRTQLRLTLGVHDEVDGIGTEFLGEEVLEKVSEDDIDPGDSQ